MVVKVREIQSRCTLDYMFMGEETGGKTLAVLAAKDRSSRALMSTVVPRKRTGEFISKRFVAFMKGAGLRDEHGDIEDRQRTGAGGCD